MRDVWKQRDELAREVDRLRAEVEYLRKTQGGMEFTAELERLRADRDLMLKKFLRVTEENERLRENIDIWQETAEDALDRLRSASEGKGKSFDPEGLSRGRSEE